MTIPQSSMGRGEHAAQPKYERAVGLESDWLTESAPWILPVQGNGEGPVFATNEHPTRLLSSLPPNQHAAPAACTITRTTSMSRLAPAQPIYNAICCPQPQPGEARVRWDRQEQNADFSSSTGTGRHPPSPRRKHNDGRDWQPHPAS
jgi:hypothetical protein